MKGPTPRRLFYYVNQCLRLRCYLRQPGDGRPQPQIPARVLLWALLIGRLLREWSFHALEQLVRSSARRALPLSRWFGDDALGYFTERLDPGPTRAALLQLLHRAKRNKAFDNCRFIGLAIDATGAGHSRQQGCSLCHPQRNAHQEVIGYTHHVSLISVVGAGLSLPFDAEPYGPDDSEYAASQRLLARAVSGLGSRFADYLVVDSALATAPFLHAADQAGLPVVARLKGNLPELSQQVEKRFHQQPPHQVHRDGKDRVEIWEADDFDPWETLDWKTVRVIRYRQHQPDDTVVQAEWLTNFSPRQAGSLSLYRMAKSRWEIENQGFNDAKNRYGFEHLCHHETNSILILWLITLLAVVIERLYRLRYLHRGRHPVRSAVQLCRLLWLGLSAPPRLDSS